VIFSAIEMAGRMLFRMVLELVVPGLLRSPAAASWFLGIAVLAATVVSLFREEIRSAIAGRPEPATARRLVH
jgi:hypothetical protein